MKRRITAAEYKEWIVDEVARCTVEGYKKIGNTEISVKNILEVSNG